MRHSPLDAVHRAAGASFTDFAGYDMPVRYSSDLAEHHAVREAAGLFDISHMAEIRVTGPGAGDYLDFALAGRLSAIAIGQAKYSLILASDGGVIDDLIVYRLGEQEFYVIANAGNREPVVAALRERVAGFEAKVTDESDDTALIAIQGPIAAEVLASLPGLSLEAWPAAGEKPAGPHSIAELGYYRCVWANWHGVKMLVARTGYTGEDGFELALPVGSAEAAWNALLTAGNGRVTQCGLAARDTLRLEAGMPLYGHELGTQWRPEQAGMGKVVVAAKEAFVGKEALAAPLSADAPVLVALESDGKRAGRAGYSVFSSAADDAHVIGEITSGALSPTLGFPIAFAMVHPDFSAEGTEIAIDVRGSKIPARVRALPFYKRQK